MANPYDTLNINRNATEEEIKKAYRELAKKYHPDNFKDNPLADLANDKMKEINEAYDEIQKERMSGSYGGNGNYFDSDFPRIRELIQNKRVSEAEVLLDSVNPNGRGAEWYYLKGVIMVENGWFFDAQKNFEKACKLDPQNREYSEAFHSIKNKSNSFYSQNGGYKTSGKSGSGCSGCDVCTGLLCADCCCECCGGDLISCC